MIETVIETVFAPARGVTDPVGSGAARTVPIDLTTKSDPAMNLEKPLTTDAIERVADTLLMLFGATTMLEVKTQLLHQGYRADEPDVFAALRDLAARKGWSVYHNGRFPVYALPITADEERDLLDQLYHDCGDLWDRRC
jgi:hypothetical protein